jgi:hypothetical protein
VPSWPAWASLAVTTLAKAAAPPAPINISRRRRVVSSEDREDSAETCAPIARTTFHPYDDRPTTDRRARWLNESQAVCGVKGVRGKGSDLTSPHRSPTVGIDVPFRRVSQPEASEEVSALSIRGIAEAVAERPTCGDRQDRRSVAAARVVELSPPDDPEALSDEVFGAVVDLVRPGRRPSGHGSAWEVLSDHRDFFIERLDPTLTGTLRP